MKITTLDSWIAGIVGGHSGQSIHEYQFNQINHTLSYVKKHSSYYQRSLPDPLPIIANEEQFASLPLTRADDLRGNSSAFTCIRQDEISRIVTIPTSGTTGEEKRICFSPADQDRIVEFFGVGMSNLIREGDRVLILFPAARPGSVGDLLAIALTRTGCEPFQAVLPFQEEDILSFIRDNRVNTLVGAPVQLNRIARWDQFRRMTPEGQIRSVLASSDYLSSSLRNTLQKTWQCEVFDHYGMTETGYGCGVECEAHQGYHLREAEYYFEVVDPFTGCLLPDGQWGEVVVTSLLHQAMPLVRYQTGDISRFLPQSCVCGSSIRRFDKIIGRKDAGVSVGNQRLDITTLDEILFSIDGVMNYTARLEGTQTNCNLILDLQFVDSSSAFPEEIIKSLRQVPVLQSENEQGRMDMLIRTTRESISQSQNSMVKRKIQDLRI